MPEEKINIEQQQPKEIEQKAETSTESKDTKLTELHESFAGKAEAGDQGILLKPVGGHDTDPFAQQDTTSSQSSTENTSPSSSTQSSNEATDGK